MDRIGAAYLRTSVGDSDETRQRDEIKKWADRTKNTIDDWFFDSGGKRHKADKRKDWQAMMTLVRQGKIEFIVVEEHTRWGYADIYQFFIHMDELRRHKVVLYEARTGRILNPHPNEMGGLITSSVQSVQSHQETANLAARSLKAKLLRAEQGQWGGGPIPYALAVACRNKTNETFWTVEQVGDSFEQHYPNGISRILTYFPTDREEKVEFLYLIPSRYQDRIEAVRCIFRWVQDEPDVSLSEITRRLIKQGYRPATGGVFRYTLVHSILNQPVYTGYYFYAKQSKARHHTQVNGTEMRALTEPENGLKPQETWVKGPKLFEPIVSQEAYDEAGKYLKNYTPRKARDNRFWLSGLLYCPNGHKLHGWCALNSRQPGLKYMCHVHRKKGKAACPHTYHVKHDQVARLVIDYLEDIGTDLQDFSLASLYPLVSRKKCTNPCSCETIVCTIPVASAAWCDRQA